MGHGAGLDVIRIFRIHRGSNPDRPAVAVAIATTLSDYIESDYKSKVRCSVVNKGFVTRRLCILCRTQ